MLVWCNVLLHCKRMYNRTVHLQCIGKAFWICLLYVSVLVKEQARRDSLRRIPPLFSQTQWDGGSCDHLINMSKHVSMGHRWERAFKILSLCFEVMWPIVEWFTQKLLNKAVFLRARIDKDLGAERTVLI